MSLSDSVKKIGFRKAYEYLDKDPDANIPKLMDWVDKFAGDGPSVSRPACRVPQSDRESRQQLVPAHQEHVDRHRRWGTSGLF